MVYDVIPSMKVFISDEAGFCFGVKRALELINQLHKKGENIQIFGQLIHNRTVLKDLESRGIKCINSEKSGSTLTHERGSCAISSHSRGK